nr:integrase, catalytic region, zinc finger, CCHC-type, peptidase aspartic, catalytic [Tanacetum cinerariifolium]
MTNVSKSISKPNEEFSDDTTSSVARKFLNEVKGTIVTLQRVVKHRMTLKTHNWSSSAHQELHKIVKDENFLIVNQVDARVQNFEIQFLKEAAKFVGDFKSLTKDASDSLAKHKASDLEIERLLRAVVSQDIMSVLQKETVVDTSNLQNELEHNKRGTSANTMLAKQSIVENLPKVGETHALSKPVTSNSVPTPQESKVVKNDKVVAPGMSRINHFKTSREAKHVPNNVRASARIKLITVSQPSVITKKDPKVKKPKKVGFIERLATPKPSKPRFLLRWSPIGRLFDQKGKIVDSSEPESQSDCSNGDNACTFNTMEPKIKWFPNFTSLLGRNDHVAAILDFGLFFDSDLEVAFRRNMCFVRNLEGVDLLKGDRSTNLYTINLHEMASASPICLMAHASSTKSWLLHQRLSHLNFDTINDLVKNDHVSGLPKFKYHKEHLCLSCEQGKSKRASHLPKPVPNSRQRLHLFHMDLCGPMRISSINGKRVGISHQMSSICTPQQNGVVERRNQTLVEAARTMLIFSHAPLFLWAEAIATACFTQNYSIIHRRFNKTPYELINGRKLDISFFHVFGALCFPKNDREDIGKLGAKGDIGFFISYSADSCAYRIYKQRTKKIIETMNVLFDELSAMDFKQRSSKPRLQSMTFGQISLGLDLTYDPSIITSQQPSEGELDLLFEVMYDDYIGGQPSATATSAPAAQAQQVHQTSTTSTSIADTA